MEIGSVSSSPYASTTASNTQSARPASDASESESAASARAEAERNRPTVNLNGQTVGTRINTTA
ncbi:MAG: hypothetical protein QM739_18400 [Propionivibrio sp.]